MDEATLTEVKRSLQMLIGRAQNVLDGLGSVDLSTNDGFSSIDPFKIAVRNFKQALGEMWRRIQSIDSSDNAAMAFALLNVEACSKALYNLLGALRKAEDALSRRVSELVASVAASRGTGTLSRSQASDGEESSLQPLRALDSIAGTTIVSLQDLQNTLWRHVSDFHDSCELLERFKRTFFRQPFHFTGPGRNYHLYGLQPRKSPHTIGFDQGWIERYSIAVKALGKIWVDHRLQAHAPVLAIAKAQITLLKHLRLLIDRETPMIQQSHRARAQAESILQALKANIEKEVVRENTQRFSVAFCGMVKAGKSLFLNTLVGRSLLPSDELPSTAWPCRLQHVKGQVVPSLEIDATYFQAGIDGLRRCKYGAMMDQFNAPEDADPFSDDIEGFLDEDMDEDMSSADTEDINELNRKREIYYIWAEFHPATQEHLLVFEQDDYQIPARADGEGDVSDLLTKVNDVVRLCRKLNVPLPNFKSSSWPLLKVEFESLRDIDVKGDFEFIDLPGIGETTIGDGDHFENLVRTVAKEANALVPIVSLKEISKDDWRQQLPHIVHTALGHGPEHVLCTHLDQAAKDRVEQQVASVAQVFWPKGENSVHRVLCCSSRLGMSARTLLHQSRQKKPDYKDFFVEGTPAYDCAEKILGVGSPEEKYNQIGLDVWNEAIRAQLKESRLESAATDLTTGIVMKTRVNALQLEGERLRILVNKGITEERRNLLDLSLSPEELEKALLAFRKTKSQLETLLKEWPEKDSRERTALSEKLDKASELLMSRGNDIATEAIEKTFKEPHWQMRVEQIEDDLKFRRKTEVELFLRSIQREMESLIVSVKREFVSFVRELATRARAERFDSLNSDIRQLVQHSMPADVLEQINNSLSSYGSDLESFILTGIRKKAVRAVVSKRHNPKTAYRAIENTIAKPFLRATSTEEGEDSQNNTEVASESSLTEEQDRTVEQLGFMLRAPVAVLATIPWLLGSAVWPFMAYSKNYVLNKKALTKELRQRAIIPYLEILRKDGRQTLDGVREQSSKVAVKAVREALEQEDLRYQQERRQKDAENPPPDVSAATSSIILLLNLLAAESGLRYLQDHLTRATS